MCKNVDIKSVKISLEKLENILVDLGLGLDVIMLIINGVKLDRLSKIKKIK